MCVYTRSINGLKAQLTEAGEREEALRSDVLGLKAQLTEAGEREEALRSDVLMSAAEKDVARAEGAAATRRVQQLEEQVVTLNPKP